MKKKFDLGYVVTTKRIADLIDNNSVFSAQVSKAFDKYKKCDWGITCKEDAALNDEALKTNERILAVYPTCKGNIWIITEWDRSVTTILFPSEY